MRDIKKLSIYRVAHAHAWRSVARAHASSVSDMYNIII